MRNAGLVLSIAALVAGCSTTPIPASSAFPVPTERRLAFQDKTPTATATLVVTRDEGFLGSGCNLAFLIDKVLAARLAPSETANFYVDPGEHLIRVSRDPLGAGLCAIDTGAGATRETILRERETKHYRLIIDQSGTMDVQRSEN